MATESIYDTIPALPATYAGIKFRSRLEAKWAYYFDLIGLPWEYEPEGYALKAGNYLPDFRCYDFFVEVKPTEAELERVEDKLVELSKVTKSSVFCVVDKPSVKPQRCWGDGQEVIKAVFSSYAFNQKGWRFPYMTNTEEDRADTSYAERANRLQFNRGGIAEVDWEVLRVRNELIQRRHDAFKNIGGRPFGEFYTEVIKPMDQRLVSLDALAFPPMYGQWSAA